MKIGLICCIASLLVLSQASLASDAAKNTLPSGMNNPLPLKYPELSGIPAPASIKEGVRATYEVVTDFPEITSGESLATVDSSAGAGLDQVTVVALEEGKAATWTVAFSPDPTSGAMKKVNFYGSVNPAGCGDFWCSPQFLFQIPDQASSDLTVMRGTYDLKGKQYNVIRIYYKSAQGIELGMIYDLETGIMLHHTADFVSSFATSEGATVSRKAHTIMTLRSLRQVNIPWSYGKIPSWVAAGTTLNFQGQHAFWLPQLPDVAPTLTPISAELSIQAVHQRYAEGRQQTYTQDPIQPAYIPMVGGIAQLMGFWVPAEALSLSPGTVDTDPDTGMIVSVVQNGPDGITMQETNNINYKLTATYDASGKPDVTSVETYSGTATGQRDTLELVGLA